MTSLRKSSTTPTDRKLERRLFTVDYRLKLESEKEKENEKNHQRGDSDKVPLPRSSVISE